MRDFHSTTTLVSTAFVAVLAMACNKPAGHDTKPRVTALEKMPKLDVKPVKWSVSNRARILRTDATKSLAQGDCDKAVQLGLESVSLDPSLAEARLDVARIFAECGVPTTALDLLEQMAKVAEHCGGCREALTASQDDKLLAPLWKTARGAKIRKSLPDLTVPVAEWGQRVAAELVKGSAAPLATLIHPNEPWQLVRSCPMCADEARQSPEKRRFFGFVVARKLAARFRPALYAQGAVKLAATGPATCQGRCCKWVVKRPLPVDTAALSMLCFRPITAVQGALTRIEIVYGQPREDAERAQPVATGAATSKTVQLPAPATR